MSLLIEKVLNVIDESFNVLFGPFELPFFLIDKGDIIEDGENKLSIYGFSASGSKFKVLFSLFKAVQSFDNSAFSCCFESFLIELDDQRL